MKILTPEEYLKEVARLHPPYDNLMVSAMLKYAEHYHTEMKAKETRWIPVEEGLPESVGDVFVVAYSEALKKNITCVGYCMAKVWFLSTSSGINTAENKRLKVIKWIKIPDSH